MAQQSIARPVGPAATRTLPKDQSSSIGRTSAVRARARRAADTVSLHRLYAESPDRELEAELMRRHEPLAARLARSFSGRGMANDDLAQVAHLALLRALRSYDPERGTSFSSYAVPTVVGALKRHFRDQGWLVRPPRRIQEAYLVVQAAMEELRAQLGRVPTVTAIAVHTGLNVDDVLESLEASGGRRAEPLEARFHCRDDTTIEAVHGDAGNTTGGAENRLVTAQLVQLLPQDERDVITLSFLSGLTQTQVAARLGLSQSTVCRLRRRALDRMLGVLRDSGEITAA
jgi:RNA polymerase sigma-B factor